MAKTAKPHKTFHISVPESDHEIMEWLSKQYNQSSSVRELIRSACREYGMVDLFVGSPAQRTPGVRGRAKQPVQQQLALAREAANEQEFPDQARDVEEAQEMRRAADAKREDARQKQDKAGGIRMDASVLDFAKDNATTPHIASTKPDKNAMKSLKDMMDI